MLMKAKFLLRYYLLNIFIIGFFSTPISCAENQAFWFDGSRQIGLFNQGYSAQNASPIYTESSPKNPQRQVLTGRIIVIFLDNNAPDLANLRTHYDISLIKKIPIGQSIYLFQVSGPRERSLTVANSLYQSELVKAAYPDWLLLPL